MMTGGLISMPLLVLHIATGFVALLSGLVAMSSRKAGTGRHAQAGNYYYLSMSLMTVSAAILTLWEPDRLTLGAAIWTFYLVHTSRSAALNRSGQVDASWRWTLPLGMLATAVFMHGGWVALSEPKQEFQGMSAVAFFVFGSGALLSLLFDLSLFWRARLTQRQRIARHLWRMVAAYFLAVTSLFLGQQDDVFPFMAGSPVLLLPSIFTLVFLIFWIVRVRFARNWLGATAPRTGGVAAVGN